MQDFYCCIYLCYMCCVYFVYFIYIMYIMEQVLYSEVCGKKKINNPLTKIAAPF